MTPIWLPREAAPADRAAELATLLEAVETGGMIGLGGPPGAGKTTLAGAVAAAARRPIVAVSLRGCVNEADATRALGAAAGTLPCGDERATAERLAALPGLLLVVDDVADVAVLAPIERMVTELADCRALVLSETTLLPHHLQLGDEGVEARLGERLGGDVEERLAALPPEVALLRVFPMGVPAGAIGPIPEFLRVPDDRGRIVLRRAVATRLPNAPLPPLDGLRKALQPLLDLGRGLHLTRAADPRDILLLRALAAHAPDASGRAELLAAEVRLLLVAGQPDVAGARLAAATTAGFAGDALVALARAELAFAVGDTDSAWSNAIAAADAQGAAGDPAGRAVTWRRVAERLAERGEIDRADEAWRRARQASRLLGDEGGVGASMRGAAALALSRGEWVGASALHEEAAETVPPPAERTNLRLGELTLALVRGENARLRRGLDALEEAASGDELLQANLARRRADALLRQGDHEGARAAADRAATLYSGLGETLAAGNATRLGADAAALAGQLAEAQRRYERALRAQVRTRDWAGLVRTLDHAALVAEAGGDAERARLWREQRAGAQRARGLEG